MSNQKLVSVIIPHFNGKELIRECLSSLLKLEYRNVEIIVVDNGSSDGSPDYIRTHFPSVRLIESERNLGYAGGVNFGAKVANGEYLFILNNDTVQESDALNHLVTAIERDYQIAAVQPKILHYYDRTRFDYAGAAGGHMDVYGFPFSRGRIMDQIEKDEGQYEDSAEIFWASGAGFLLRRELFQQLNGFDEGLFAHMEEIDLCWKLQLMNLRIVYEAMAVIYHKDGATLSHMSDFKTYLNHRNSLILLLGNYRLMNSILLFLPRLILELVSAFRELAQGKLKQFTAHTKAWWWILSHPTAIVKRRKIIAKLRKIDDNRLMQRMYRRSIVWKFFLQKRKKYSDLDFHI